MGKPKGGAENSKKAAGNARKADAAARKQADADAAVAAQEDAQWSDGAKGKNAKKAAEEAKKEEARRKKAEREAELELEDSLNKSKPQASKNKGRDKILSRQRGIDSALASSEPGLSARNIDDAISALEITSGKSSDKIDRHPERRFKAALSSYEERRLPEIRQEHPGLRLNQYKELIYKEFQKSDENPFNQVTVDFNASRGDVQAKLDAVKSGKAKRLEEF